MRHASTRGLRLLCSLKMPRVHCDSGLVLRFLPPPHARMRSTSPPGQQIKLPCIYKYYFSSAQGRLMCFVLLFKGDLSCHLLVWVAFLHCPACHVYHYTLLLHFSCTCGLQVHSHQWILVQSGKVLASHLAVHAEMSVLTMQNASAPHSPLLCASCKLRHVS